MHYSSQILKTNGNGAASPAKPSEHLVTLSYLRQQLSEGGPGALLVADKLLSHQTRPSKNSLLPYPADILLTFPSILRVSLISYPLLYSLPSFHLLSF
jgi:hypothetical protein